MVHSPSAIVQSAAGAAKFGLRPSALAVVAEPAKGVKNTEKTGKTPRGQNYPPVIR
jgi:hypothetical protein